MNRSGFNLDYSGVVDHEKIDFLLKKLYKSPEYLRLDKTIGKRLYSIMVECLDNISRYSPKKHTGNQDFQPFISVFEQNDVIIIKAGNTVAESNIASLICRLREINNMESESLKAFYEKIINKEAIPEGKGAGLGFVIMKLKSCNNIAYSFEQIDNFYSYFKIEVSLNKYIMRKLIMEKTASSPKVVLDPEKRLFEISGESRPSDPATFYGEIIEWLNEYSTNMLRSKDSNYQLVFIIDLNYFNSSSARYLLDFFKLLASVRDTGKWIDIRWKYESDDLDMLEAGREMSRLAKMPFEFIIKVN